MIFQLVGGKKTNLISKSVTANGIYDARDYNADGFDIFTVAVPEPTGTINITTNGTKNVKNYEFANVNVPNGTQTKTITTNGTYTPTAPNIGFSSVTVNVPVPVPVVRSLYVTPTTGDQTITASGGVDGYSPITVGAVTSSIDANISAGNIKSGVSILGVSGNVVELNGTTKTITPTTSSQTVSPAPPNNAFTQVTVQAVTSSIDANITAENIKNGVTILGVTGNYSGLDPMSLKLRVNNSNILIHDNTTVSTVIDLGGATNLGRYILAYAYNNNTNISGELDFSSLTAVNGEYACTYCFSGCTGLTGVDLSGLTALSNTSIFSYAFSYCTGITSIKMQNLKNITGQYACDHMFAECTGITTVDLSSVELIQGSSSCQYMFYGCYNLRLFDLSALKTVSTQYGCRQMFGGCESLESLVQLQSLETVGYYGCYEMFYGCTTIKTVYFSALKTITQLWGLSRCFMNCTTLSNLYFPALTSTSFGSATNQFDSMLSGVTGCTVHFPSNLQSVIGSWTDVQNGFGGTNTTVLFDLTPTS